MAQTRVYQIYYSEGTKRELDPGFLPLDNSLNLRPDWREYWPIRNFLLNNPLTEDDYYGFFSPRFRRKTGLTSEEVTRFVLERPVAPDVVIFSPFFDESALYLNVFEQGDRWHRGFAEVAQAFLNKAGTDHNLRALVTHAGNTVFCNYIVARPRFWREWMKLNECLFTLAESDDPIGRDLNQSTMHDGRVNVPMKVFMMERTATLLLATQREWHAVAYDPSLLPLADRVKRRYLHKLVACDALKLAFATHGFTYCRREYFRLRDKLPHRFGLAIRRLLPFA